MIGLYRGTVAVEPHNEEWEVTAQQTAELLKLILGDTAADIQHIGSTAIKSICAKPIIDIVIGVRRLDDILDMNSVLEENGFLFRGQDHPGQYLYVCGKDNFITHHIHVTEYASEAWDNYVNMRDYLNCHDSDAKAYSLLKKALAKQFPDDRIKYTGMKSSFISGILAKAAQWRRLN